MLAPALIGNPEPLPVSLHLSSRQVIHLIFSEQCSASEVILFIPNYPNIPLGSSFFSS